MKQFVSAVQAHCSTYRCTRHVHELWSSSTLIIHHAQPFILSCQGYVYGKRDAPCQRETINNLNVFVLISRLI